MTSFREYLIRLGGMRVVEPMISFAYSEVIHERWLSGIDDNPHGRPWHTSFHASSFPGDAEQACGRAAMYGMMDVPRTPADRWLHNTAQAGKQIELDIVRHIRDAGYLCRSNQQGRSSDPDANMPQMGFVDAEHWLTGSVDMPMLPFNYSAPLIVEIKTKHENKLGEMMMGAKDYDPKHRNQLLCSLGLAHENASAFKHPSQDLILDPAREGAIYYHARDTTWPGPPKTFEFFFAYDPGFMEQGRKHLKEWKKAFLENYLPQEVERKNSRSHPFGWKWSEGVCRFCDHKKACKKDYETNTTDLLKSHAVSAARFLKPGYDADEKREIVLRAWPEDSKPVSS